MHLEGAEDLGRRGGLVVESEDQDAGLDLFGREQAEAAGLPPEFHLCGGRWGESNIGQSSRKSGVGCLVKGGKPVVEEVAGGGVGDEAHLVAWARKANEDGGVNGADVGCAVGGHRSVGRIAEDNGVDLVGIVIVFLVGSWDAPECGAGGTICAGAAGVEMCISCVTQGIEDRGERTDGDNDSEQDGCWAERLAASDIEAGSGEYGEIDGQALLHEWVALGLSRRGPGWRRSGEVGHTHSVDALLPGAWADDGIGDGSSTKSRIQIVSMSATGRLEDRNLNREAEEFSAGWSVTKNAPA
jgi:hypothetical protein